MDYVFVVTENPDTILGNYGSTAFTDDGRSGVLIPEDRVIEYLNDIHVPAARASRSNTIYAGITELTIAPEAITTDGATLEREEVIADPERDEDDEEDEDPETDEPIEEAHVEAPTPARNADGGRMAIPIITEAAPDPDDGVKLNPEDFKKRFGFALETCKGNSTEFHRLPSKADSTGNNITHEIYIPWMHSAQILSQIIPIVNASGRGVSVTWSGMDPVNQYPRNWDNMAPHNRNISKVIFYGGPVTAGQEFITIEGKSYDFKTNVAKLTGVAAPRFELVTDDKHAVIAAIDTQTDNFHVFLNYGSASQPYPMGLIRYIFDAYKIYIYAKFGVMEGGSDLDRLTNNIRVGLKKKFVVQQTQKAQAERDAFIHMQAHQEEYYRAIQDYQKAKDDLNKISVDEETYLGKVLNNILAIKSVMGVEDISVSGDIITVRTSMMFCLDPRVNIVRRIGVFDILIDKNTSKISFRNNTLLVKGYNSDWCHAPHIFGNGSACLGDLQNLVPSLLTSDDYVSVVAMCIDFLQSAAVFDSAGKYVHRWPKATDKEAEQFRKEYPVIARAKI